MGISERAFASWQGALSAVAFAAAATYGADVDAYWDNAVGVLGADGYVTTVMAVDGAAYAGGYFTNIGGIKSQGVAKWDGSRWQDMVGGVQGGLQASVYTLAAVGASVYAGGVFTEAGGVPVKHLARWDGRQWRDVDGGVEYMVRTLAVDGNDLYVGGVFGHVGSVVATNVARWDGSTWHALGGGCSGEIVDALAVHDQALYASWQRRDPFTGVSSFHLTKWNRTNWTDTGIVGYASRLYSGRQGLWAGGEFGNQWPWRCVALWNGSAWSYDVADFRAQDMVVAFTEAQGVSYLAVNGAYQSATVTALMSRADSWWRSAGTVTGSANNPAQVTSLASNGTELFVGGVFESVGGKAATNLAVWHVPRALKAVRQGDQCVLSWPAPDTDMALEAADSPSAAQWQAVDATPVVVGHRLTVTNTVASTARFYRLRQR